MRRVQLDVASNRRARKWSRTDLLRRVLWGLVQPAFRFSPRLLWGWRRWLLRRFGARIGPNVHLYPTVRILIPWTLNIEAGAAVGDGAILYALGEMRIGARATISQGAHLCAGTHDWRDPAFALLKSSLTIEDDAWICADAFVGPDVTVGARAIVGARAVAMKDVPAGAIVAGNPASVLRMRDAAPDMGHDAPPATP